MISGEARRVRRVLWEKCDHCGLCVQVCPTRALEMVGEWLTVDQVMDVVRRDSVYYENSGGGVTFSGGEPTAQPRFLAACAQQCREEGIHTALDTCGFVEWTVLDTVLPHIDLFLFDLKHMDSQEHERLTGVSNDLILENLQRIDQRAKPIWIRIPLIPGHNDSKENLGGIAEMARHLAALKKISILPYNSAAGANYRLIGRDYGLEGLDYVKEREQDILRIFATTGITVEIGR
jgi:pyruvate formate lyase activating enzyme